MTTYQVDPALEYRSLVHVSSEPMTYHRPSIRRDNRLLAVGSNQGVVLWDLARGTECAFLPIGIAWHVMFEATGDLLTSGAIGVRRWPVQLDSDRSEFRIGPPRRPALLERTPDISPRTGWAGSSPRPGILTPRS